MTMFIHKHVVDQKYHQFSTRSYLYLYFSFIQYSNALLNLQSSSFDC